ncbi:MAG: efflux RND transporter permease subunit, partial [Anaerolineae bacterium]
MKSLFSQLTSLALRFRTVTLALVVLVTITGIIAITQLKQELIPSIEFPQTIILSEVAGMSSEQVLDVLTKRLESALGSVPEIVNMESTTTGSFGAIITARNDFGVNQERLRGKIQDALDQVWLPVRMIAPPDGENPQAFAERLLGDMTPDVLIYLAQNDSNFPFQLAPEVWQALPDDTVKALLTYLAGQTQESAGQESELRRLVEQEIVPALESIPQVANVSVSGGQALPGDGDAVATPAPAAANAPSLMPQLTPAVWQIASTKAGISGTLDASAVEKVTALNVEAPSVDENTPPALPESWQMDRFKDASDLIEMRTLTRSIGSTFNTFESTGRIVGALGQTDDLTPDVIAQMLAIDPTMVNYFKAEQLAAMPDDVFAALPDDYIAGLDGITRDALAAKALASALTGEEAASEPVNLPSAWKIQPPQLITFSFDDLPLANYSISGMAAPSEQTADTPAEVASQPTPAPTEEATPIVANIPEGPALPEQFNLLGAFFGVTLDTADDLLTLQLPEAAAQQLGSTHPSPAQLFNALALLSNPQTLAALPLAQRLALGALDVGGVFGDLSPEAVQFIDQYDPTFLPSLSADVYALLSDAVLALPEAAPPLDTVWDNLATQPQFGSMPLHSAKDILALGGGSASSVLNNINTDVPERFAGYEVRLFDSLSPGIIRYFVAHEPEFFTNLDPAVLLKLSPEALALVPQDVIASLPGDTATQLSAIASGEQESAAAELASRYATDVPPADPNAPPLNADWATIGNFLSVELDTADDFFRFFPNAANFLNSFFDSAQGAAFAPNLFGGLTLDDINYMVGRDPNLLNDLRIEALQLLSPDVVARLPQDVQDRIASGATPFVPTDNVTRTNGNPSLVVTVYKTADSNNVEAFHIVDDALHAIATEHPSIQVNVAFEQASFVEESISGVAREGGLGAIFAVIVILVFLSSGTWSSSPRRIVGSVMVALFLVLLALYVLSNMPPSGDLGDAFASSDVVVRVLLIGGALAGLAILLYPGKLPYPSWRSTLVTGVSIPLSVLIAMTLMRWLPPAVHGLLADSADTSPLISFALRLFPSSITLNIMTLSGLTVAIGRVVDDSIVVLENIFRHVQEGGDKREAIIQGTRDVSVAIFAATVITVVVFLPLGLTGGIIGEIFLPFGLAVTYALLSSFVVAITVVPVLAYLLLDNREISGEHESWLERVYQPTLRWVLDSAGHRWAILGVAVISLVIGGALFASRP